jgi:phosphatidyl-myo-inositol alpha-mannosyltransferase
MSNLGASEMRRLRIGMFSPYSLTLPGGVQGQVLALARALRLRGHDVRVLGPCDGPPPEPGITPLGNSIPTAANGSMAPIAPDASAVLRTIRALRDEEFDLLHLHEPFAPGPTITALIYKPCPIVGTFHAAGTSASYRYFRRALRSVSSRLDARCAVSDDAVLLAQGVVGGEFLQLFNGVEVERFANAEPILSDRRTILFVGRHEERKGLEVLLRTLPMLPADVDIWVTSNGPQTDTLRRTYPDRRIHWLGRVSDTELARRFAGASLYCAPSLGGESFGVVLLEAMSAGTPVVASAIDGYRNVATDGLDALLTPPGDVSALAVALNATLAGGPAVEQRIAVARKRAEGYSMAALATAYEGIYTDVLRRVTH